MGTNPNSRGLWEKTIHLTSGGHIRIEVIGHPLDMAEDDRTFVEQLVDTIREYETDAKKYGKSTELPGEARPAVCSHPSLDENGCCHTCGDGPLADGATLGTGGTR